MLIELLILIVFKNKIHNNYTYIKAKIARKKQCKRIKERFIMEYNITLRNRKKNTKQVFFT